MSHAIYEHEVKMVRPAPAKPPAPTEVTLVCTRTGGWQSRSGGPHSSVDVLITAQRSNGVEGAPLYLTLGGSFGAPGPDEKTFNEWVDGVREMMGWAR